MNKKQDLFKVIDRIGQFGVVNLVEELKVKQVFDKPEYYSRLKKQIREKSKKLSQALLH